MKKNFNDFLIIVLIHIALLNNNLLAQSRASFQCDLSTGIKKRSTNFICTEGKFEIYFWGIVPEKAVQMVDIESGNVEMVSYMYEKSFDEAYIIAYSDYSDSVIGACSPSIMLENARMGALESCNISSSKQRKVNGFPSVRTYAYQPDMNEYFVYEVILAKNRLYQIIALKKGQNIDRQTVKDFFGSFRTSM